MPEEQENICKDCEHTFHVRRCFVTHSVGRNYIQCPCKKGVK